ncbi:MULTISPECIES: PIN domain-containing protein [unclassified Methanoculleus]|uniref:type II toxin-antitoxin system VapC family toxin n=1 Tax=unclassified Methanoculleus TaxID=2619537 RepID=UPI0025CD5979|nr:PIN domain-containing protein [Methanoculleus sp. UBA303]MCE5337894.1 nucleotide-binding protein [Methanomicrobiaceae archaeon]MDD3934064.1 nucleotide-binding protein [Methanoculleus sp.]
MAADRHGYSGRVKVLLDTNALLMPAQFGIDLYDELMNLFGDFEPVTLEEVVGELRGLTRGRGRDAAAARVGLALALRSTIVPSGSAADRVDDRVIEYARRERCTVVTNDRELRNALLREEIDVVSMRRQRTLELMRG